LPAKTLHASLLSAIRVSIPYPSHSYQLDHLNYIWWGVQIIKPLLCSFLPSPITSYLLRPNIIVNTLFSNTLSLRSSLYVSNHVSHPYNTTDKILLIFIFLDIKLEDKRFCIELWHVFFDSNLPLISSWIQFWFVKTVPKYLKFSTLSKELLSTCILRFRPAFWSRLTIYLTFTPSPISKGFVFFLYSM
jgi:hypothetical protein